MNHQDSRNKRGRKQAPKRDIKFINKILLVAILLIIVVAAVRLIRWNIGEKSDYDPGVVNTEYDVEVLDQIFYVSEERLTGHEDDGEEQILFLGNDPFSDERGKDGLTAMIGERTGATVYNASFPGTMVGVRQTKYDGSYPSDLFSFYYLSNFISQNDFSVLDANIGQQGEGFQEGLDALKSVDFSKLDMIVVMYDAQDYLNKMPVMDAANDMNPTSYSGAMKTGLKLIQDKYPYIRIVMLSPTLCYLQDRDGQRKDSNMVDLGNGDLNTYVLKAIDSCMDEGVSYIDNYHGTVDEKNADSYLKDDFHLTKKARLYIADHFTDKIFPKADQSK